MRDIVRAAEPPQLMIKFMGWNKALAAGAATPTYPCLIDERHSLGALYGIINVPTAVWIDEAGHMVRAPEPPAVTDGFRSMDLQTFTIPRELAEDSRLRRQIYVDAVRDWVENGAASRHVLPPDEVRRRMRGVSAGDSLAEAHFRLGLWLLRTGARDAARTALDEAVRLRPESWRYRRQKIVLLEAGLTGQLAATPEYWQAVQALGDDDYYPPIEMDGMPPPRRR